MHACASASPGVDLDLAVRDAVWPVGFGAVVAVGADKHAHQHWAGLFPVDGRLCRGKKKRCSCKNAGFPFCPFLIYLANRGHHARHGGWLGLGLAAVKPVQHAAPRIGAAVILANPLGRRRASSLDTETYVRVRGTHKDG